MKALLTELTTVLGCIFLFTPFPFWLGAIWYSTPLFVCKCKLSPVFVAYSSTGFWVSIIVLDFNVTWNLNSMLTEHSADEIMHRSSHQNGFCICSIHILLRLRFWHYYELLFDSHVELFSVFRLGILIAFGQFPKLWLH